MVLWLAPSCGPMKIKEWLILLLILGSALRLGFWFIGEPTAFPDTGTYIEVAKQLVSGDFSNYQGRRTPGYPLLLILAQLSPHAVWIIHRRFRDRSSGWILILAGTLAGGAVMA